MVAKPETIVHARLPPRLQMKMALDSRFRGNDGGAVFVANIPSVMLVPKGGSYERLL